MDTLCISLFGGVQVTRNDMRSKVRIPPKAQALLSYLLLQGPRLHPREIVAHQLWSDYPETRARGCLSTTLWRLRSALEQKDISPDTYILTPSTDEIGFNWNSDHWFDVVVFENKANMILRQPYQTTLATDIHELEEILKLYIGDLLEGFYDDWAIREQERLNCLYMDCLEYLMKYYRHVECYDKSLGYGQRIVAQEPIRESIHREMMQLYLLCGQRTLAIRQYETCQQILAEDLNLPPMAETQALYYEALQNQASPSSSLPMITLQHALKQLNIAAKNFEAAQQQLKLARQHCDESQLQLNKAIRLVERLTNQ